jgi:hypothetical protein
MHKLILAFSLLLCGAPAFPLTLELFGALPVVANDASESPITYLGGAAGIGLTSLDQEDTFGVTVTSVFYAPFKAESPAQESGAALGDLFAIPFGVHVSLGCSVLPFETISGEFSFPVTVGLHTKTDLLKNETHLDLGVSTTLGIKISRATFSGFLRAEVFFDMYRIIFPVEGKVTAAGPNVLGFIPQAGIGIFL